MQLIYRVYRGISYQHNLNSHPSNHSMSIGLRGAKYRGVSYFITQTQQKSNPLENHSGQLIAKYRGVAYATSAGR